MDSALTLQDWLFQVVRWVHIAAAVTWVGGSVFMSLVASPLAAANDDAARAVRGMGQRYSDLVSMVIIALILTGILLTVERAYFQSVGALWFAVLGVKLALAAWMGYIIWRQRSMRALRRLAAEAGAGRAARLNARLSLLLGYNALAALGVVVFLLASLLRFFYESSN